jgi:mannose-6-phosphate isomerase
MASASSFLSLAFFPQATSGANSGTAIPPYFLRQVKRGIGNGMLAAEFTGGYPSFGFAENTDDLFVGKTLLHGDVLMWLMKNITTSGGFVE